ncbi:hypothetical protein M9H77_07836 [Catharanthus roseus]|uniref:Uncharacterized protein n=1 Tax=Catharanthus roseus TaxID=4058 RepID=A0ACC0BWD2_CATRO|nr:hypothetical protein M9H77_07836 [Catharanthus roseus]
MHGGFGRCTTDWKSLSVSSDLGVVAYTYIAASADDGDSGRLSYSSWRNMCTVFDCNQLPMHTLVTYRDQLDFMPSDQWRLRVRDGPAVAVAALSYPSDEYIRWYRVITRDYISNPANRETRAHGYQPAGVDKQMMTSMLQEVDDMASVAIREPPSSPSQMATVLKKVQTIILHRRGARRHPGRGARGGRPPVPPAPQRQEHVDSGPAVIESGEGSGSGQQYVDPFDSPHLDMPSYSLGLTPASQTNLSGSGTSQMPPTPGLGFVSFQSLHSSAYGFFGFRAPPPPSTAGSSTTHQPISQATSSNEEERQDDMEGLQAFGFGHRVGKKTV